MTKKGFLMGQELSGSYGKQSTSTVSSVLREAHGRSNIRYGVLRGATVPYKLFCNFVRKRPLFYMVIGLQLTGIGGWPLQDSSIFQKSGK